MCGFAPRHIPISCVAIQTQSINILLCQFRGNVGNTEFASPSGATVSPGVMFHNTASNIICQVLFGKRYDDDDDFIKVVVQCFKENSKIANGPWAMVSSYGESHSKKPEQNIFLHCSALNLFTPEDEKV